MYVSYPTKTIVTVLGPVVLHRAYYHCRDCGRWVIPRDAQLGVSGKHSNNPACFGAPAAPPPSSPCAASGPAQRDRATHKPDAHPLGGACSKYVSALWQRAVIGREGVSVLLT